MDMKMMSSILLNIKYMIKIIKIIFIIKKKRRRRKKRDKEVEVLEKILRRGKESKRQIGKKKTKRSKKIRSKIIKNKRINLLYHHIFLTLSQLKGEEYVMPRCSLTILRIAHLPASLPNFLIKLC